VTNVVALPQARIPIGHCTVNGQRVEVEIDIEWMRSFTALVARTGGTTTEITLTEATELIFTLQAEIDNARSRNDGLLQKIAELEARIEDIRIVPDLTGRVQTIEERLQ
jgi:hypothetical protein